MAMLNKAHRIIQSLERGETIWILGLTTALLVVAFNLFRLPDLIAEHLGYSGSQRMFAIDLKFNYSPAWVYAVLNEYGEKGRHAYAFVLVLFDFLFPLLYSLFLATALSAVFSGLLPQGSAWQKLSLVGLLAGVMDWLENLGILSLLHDYPREIPALVNLTNVFTIAKDGFACLSLLLLIGAGMWLAFKRKVQVQPPSHTSSR